MADPTNPNPTNPTPPSAGGPPSPPVDPGTASVFERMASAMELANQKAEASEKAYTAMATQVASMTEAFKANLKVSESIEAVMKKRVELGKKLKNLSDKDLEDAKKSKKELEQIAKLYEEGLKLAQKNTKESREMTKNLNKVKEFLKNVGAEAKLSGKQISEMKDLLGDAARNTNDLADAMSKLTKTGAALKGFTGILGAMGIGKGMNRNLERRLEQIREVKDKVEESRQLRKAATAKHMGLKREKALEEMRGASAKGGLSVNPETGVPMKMFDPSGELTSGGRHTLAQKMGFTRGSKKYSQFVGGEAQLSETAGAEAGPAYAAAMEGGGGAIEGVMTAFEGGIEGLMVGLETVALPLTILIGAIELLSKLFGEYVKQNQEMEKNLGKGGLFTQPGVGAGTAFMQARDALRPRMGTGTTELGINFERNLAIAGAMANQGFASAQGLGIGETGPGVANMGLGPGQQDEFMKGGVGEVQRIVMGAGRVGGLTDQEGVEQVLKLLSEYRETMASSEMFMAQVNKDTAAAGISTTKYLKIIDEVSSSFDKMGKSLEQVTGVMRELSRYGNISSESLKDMMDFLESGQQKTNMSNVQTAAFTQAVMDPDTLKSLQETEKATLGNYVEALNAEGREHGVSTLDISAAINKGDFAGAQGQANKMRQQINDIKDPTVKQSMTDNLQKIQDQINRVGGVMSPDFLNRAASQGLYKEDPAQTIAALFTNLKFAARSGGTTMKNLMEGGGSAETKILTQQLSEALGVKAGGYANAFEMMRDEAANRVRDVTTATNPTDRSRLGKAIFSEFYKGAKTKGGIAQYLEAKGMGQYVKDNYEATIDNMLSTEQGRKDFSSLAHENLDAIADSGATQDKILKANADGNKQGADAMAAQINQAKAIGSRTQSVGDLLSNTFKPLLIKLIHGLEGIATVVSKLASHFIGGTETAEQVTTAKEGEMADLGSAVDKLTTNVETQQADLRNFQVAHTNAAGKMSKTDADTADKMSDQIQIGADTLKKLEEIKDRGAFKTGAEENLAMAAVKNIIGGGAAGKLEGAGFQSVVVNNYYSSMVQQDTTPQAGPGSSPSEGANPPKGTTGNKKQ
jgi:hypothetical protein